MTKKFRVTVVVHDRHSCPFRVPEDYETCGPPGPMAKCEHPRELERIARNQKKPGSEMPISCQSYYSHSAVRVEGYPHKCPLRDGDSKET